MWRQETYMLQDSGEDNLNNQQTFSEIAIQK